MGRLHLLLVGNYGAGNLGDDLLREYFLTRFAEIDWTVVTTSPRRGAKEVPRLPTGLRSCVSRAWWRTFRAFRRTDGVVFGGGSLFTDGESVFACFLWWLHARLARACGKPVFFTFQGVGPFRTRVGEWLARSALRDAPFVSVRDTLSASRIGSWGLNTEIVQSFDPVFLLMEEKKQHRSATDVLIAVPRKNSGATFGGRLRSLAAEPRFREVRILSLEPQSEVRSFPELAKGVPKPAKTVLVSTLDRLLSEVGGAAFVLSQRYHATLAALALGVPFESVTQGAGDKHASLADLLHADPAELLERVRGGERALRAALERTVVRSRPMALTTGQAAPRFVSMDQNGIAHRLEEYRGRWLLLYFYPKDDTPGCTKEACGFRDLSPELSRSVAIVGVSADSVESHAAFAEKYDLPFTLLADPTRDILGAFGIGTDFAKRTSFLIDPEGVIRTVYERVDCEKHAAEVMADLLRAGQREVA